MLTIHFRTFGIVLTLILSVGCGRSTLTTLPITPDGSALSVPNLGTVTVEPGLGSAVLTVPAVAGAGDYRAFASSTSTSVLVGGDREQVNGGVIFCAGFQQHNAPKIQVDGINGPTQFVVEAIDKPCPFPGAFGRTHADIPYPQEHPDLQGSFSIFTEAEIRARYGSMIINGQGPGRMAGQPAEPVVPRVLAQTTVTVSPLALSTAVPRTTFFDDFSQNDQPVLVGDLPEATDGRQGFYGELYQNTNWSFYTYNAEHAAHVFIDRGVLRVILPDAAQGPFSTMVAFPRRPVQLSSTRYLHATFQTAGVPTGRRYWWMTLCGAAQAGQTMDADGRLVLPLDSLGRPTAPFVGVGFFMLPDGRNPSLAMWNCLQIFPQGGTLGPVPPTFTPVESQVTLIVNRPGVNPSVVNVNPDQLQDPNSQHSWYRQQNASGLLAATILDDQQRFSPRTTYDLYIRRDRVVLYVEGEQRLCNDFAPVALTMAEGALGFGNVLYHSAEERWEFIRAGYTGLRQLLNNTPFLTAPTWDNMGYEEGVSAPPGFDPTACFAYRG